MSDTIVDFPKVAQMLDAGWQVQIVKNDIGSYSAMAHHPEAAVRRRTRSKMEAFHKNISFDHRDHWNGDALITDDFTPEQSLTRLAYKVHGEII